jgi:hydrogenase expression/formation protein HypD
MVKLRDAETAAKIVKKMKELDVKCRFMYICGTHQDTIVRFGLTPMLAEAGIEVHQGPGCPVCVTTSKEVADAITLARAGITVTAFGDMMRVPTTIGSLFDARAEGADVRIVYSIEDAVRMAREQPGKPLVFVGVGFETTTPAIAASIQRAQKEGLKNFTVFVAHKNMPGALEAIIADPNLKVDALILPGHVSTIIGMEPYEFLAKKYHIPGVITGFKALDILEGIAMIMRQLHEGRAEIENAYTRSVMTDGNPAARAIIEEVFDTCTATWRGLGDIPGSGYCLREKYADFDAVARFQPEVEPTIEPKGCRCGDVLRGILTPKECPLFRRACNPENPLGPCMVSSEGTCSAYYRYFS